MIPIIFAAGAAAFAGIFLSGCSEKNVSDEQVPAGLSREEYVAHQAALARLGVQNPYSPIFGVGTFWRSANQELSSSRSDTRDVDPLIHQNHNVILPPPKVLEKGAEALVNPLPEDFEGSTLLECR